jgi:hypothetical protein
MPVIGKVELKADKDVTAGTETSISDLFPYSERRKEFTLESDVERDKTKIKVTIAKLGSFETVADTTKKKGEKTDLWMILKATDFSRKIKATEAIKKGDVITVTIESI